MSSDENLATIARAFIDYYIGEDGCSNCGGQPHSSTCFAGRFIVALRQPVLSVEGLRAKVEALNEEAKTYPLAPWYDKFMPGYEHAIHDVLEILVDPAEATELDRLRNLCAEMYQVAGTLGADSRVLDTLSAAANGQPLPHGTLLPYAAPVEAQAPQEWTCKASKGAADPQQECGWPTCGCDSYATKVIEALPARAQQVSVAGRMERTIADFKRACLVHLEGEQQKLNPNNALIGVLCDAVRLARESCEARAPQEAPAEDQGETLIDLAKRLAEDIDFAVDVTEPRDVRLARFRTLIEAVIGGWEADEQSEDTVIVNAVTAAVREADQAFQTTGGSSKHWVRDCFLPTLNSAGLFVAQRAPQPAEPTRATDIDEDCCSDAPTGVHSPGCDHAGTPARPGMGSMTPEQSRFERAVKGDAAITRVAELEAKVATLTTELRTAQDAAQENWQDDKPLTEELAAALKLADSNLHPGRYPDPAFTIDGAEGPSHMHALVTALRELLKTHQTTCICAIHEAARAALAASEPASKPEKE